MAAFGLHHLALPGQVGVEQRRARGGVGARRVDTGRRTIPSSTRDHGELIRTSRSAVIKVVRWRAGLERASLRLGGAGVRRREVGVVARGRGHGRHADADGGADGGRGVGEGARVVHAGVGDGRQRREGAVDAHPRVAERRQVRRAWGGGGREGRRGNVNEVGRKGREEGRF